MIDSFQTQSFPHSSRLQHSFAGACVALLLSLGLVSIPMSCACGTGVPHGHSLFILGGHYHGADQVYFDADEIEGQNHNGHKVDASSASGPQLAGRIMHSADRVAVMLPLALLSAKTWQRVAQPIASFDFGEGRVDTPDSPPPKSAFQV